MRIIDCFMYYDEDLILDIRLNILDKFVAYFVICEANFNHNGTKREFKFDISKFSKFKEKTGCPIVVNTSFNVRGEPIVNTPLDAYKCFMSSDIDVLVIENFYFEKKLQNKKFLKNYKNCFQLD